MQHNKVGEEFEFSLQEGTKLCVLQITDHLHIFNTDSCGSQMKIISFGRVYVSTILLCVSSDVNL